MKSLSLRKEDEKMEIFFRNRSKKKLIPALKLRCLTLRVIKELLDQYPFKNPQLSILFVDDDQIRAMNKKYRKVNCPTDVLSFPMLEKPGAPHSPDEITTLGDIVISLETSARQSGEMGHSLEKEIVLLLVHGFLHLLNYDDQKPIDRRRMLALQKRWMKRLEKENVC